MTHYDADEIVPPGQPQKRVMMGRVSQIHRPDRTAEAGDNFEINGATYEITDVTERPLSEITVSDARKEAARSMMQFRQRIQSVDPDFEWTDGNTLVRYQFRRQLPSDED